MNARLQRAPEGFLDSGQIAAVQAGRRDFLRNAVIAAAAANGGRPGIPMPPMPDLSETDAAAPVRWILGGAAEAGARAYNFGLEIHFSDTSRRRCLR
ncbi:MAG: hypothetical protein ABIR98_12260 [Usitatibacter sp.]